MCFGNTSAINRLMERFASCRGIIRGSSGTKSRSKTKLFPRFVTKRVTDMHVGNAYGRSRERESGWEEEKGTRDALRLTRITRTGRYFCTVNIDRSIKEGNESLDSFAPSPMKTFRRRRRGRKPIAYATNCTRAPLDGVKSRGSLVIARASINIHSGCGCASKKREREKRRKKRGKGEKRERDKIKQGGRAPSPDPRSQQGFASISDVVIDLGAVKA